MIALEKFFQMAEGCNLSKVEICLLFALLRKSAIIYTISPKKSLEDRRKIDKKIQSLLKTVELSKCVALKRNLVLPIKKSEIEVKIEACKKKCSPFLLSRILLNRRAEIYKKIIDIDTNNKFDEKHLKRVSAWLERRRKKAGQKAWKYGLLATAASATAILTGLYVHSHSKKEKDDRKEIKK